MKNETGFLSRLKRKWDIEVGNISKSTEKTTDGKILYHDWGQKNNAENEWFTKFIRYRFPELQTQLNFYGVCGKGRFVRKPIEGKKIFFTPENVDKKFMKWNWLFGDYGLPYVDLAMGFGEISDAKYLRFPLWIQYMFSPTANDQEIEKTINKINETRYKKVKECALIAGHDKHGTRTHLYNGLKDILSIDCAGRWQNNTTDLWEKYNNNKVIYLQNFKFVNCNSKLNKIPNL